MIEQAIRYHCANNAGIAALAPSKTFIAGGVPESATRPYLTFQRISTMPTDSQDGDVGLDEARFQFSAVADTAAESLTLAAAVRTAFTGSGHRFVMATGQAYALTVLGCTVESVRDTTQNPTDGAQRGPFTRITDIQFSFSL